MKLILTLLFTLLSIHLFAQQKLTLSGNLREAGSNFPLPNGTLTLLNSKDTLRTSSNNAGSFHFENLRAGNYKLISAYVSFSPDTQFIRLTKDTTVTVKLKSGNRQLTEVVIRSEIPPATVRQDTIAFNTQAYKNRPNAPVEELLRKLPGVQIDADGNVTIQGQKVDKVLIDGKPFFLDDLRKATRNLPADVIAQVEVFGSQSEENKQAGITDNSTTKTINLKLKRNKKDGWIGKLYAGYGTNESYAAGGNVTELNPKRFFAADFLLNNLHDQFTGIENNLPAAPAGKQTDGRFNLNFRQDFNKQITIEAFGSGNLLRSTQQGSDRKHTYLPDSTLLSAQQNSGGNTLYAGNFGGRVTYKPNEKTFLNDQVSWQPGATRNNNQDSTLLRVMKGAQTDTASQGLTANSSKGTSNLFSNELSLVRRFSKKHRALQVSLGLQTSRQENRQDIFTRVISKNPFDTTSVNQRSVNPVNNTTLNGSATYSEPLGEKHVLRLSYHISASNNHSLKLSDNYDVSTGAYDVPDTLTSNHFENKNTTQALHLTYSNLPQEKLYFQLGLGGQNISQESLDLTHFTDFSRNDQNFLPEATLIYHATKGKHIDLHYRGSSQNPSIEQLQPLPDLSNPYLVRLGNPELRPSYTHALDASYFSFGSENFHNLQIYTHADLVEHPISGSAQTLDGGVQQVQFVNLQPNFHFAANLEYGFPLINQSHGNGGIGAHVNYGSDRSVVNGLDNTDQSKAAGLDIRLFYHAGNKLFADASSSLSLVNNHYTLAGQTDNNTVQQNYSFNLTWLLPWALTAGAHYNIELRSTTGLPNQQSSLLNASLAKDLFGGHNAQLRLSGFNLLQSTSSISQINGPDFTETRTTNTPQRTILLSFVYNFQKFNTGG